jgi:hypothetical protein
MLKATLYITFSRGGAYHPLLTKFSITQRRNHDLADLLAKGDNNTTLVHAAIRCA